MTRIRPFGEGALLVEVGTADAARGLGANLASQPIPGVEAAVPGLASVLVELASDAFDDAARIEAAVRDRLASSPAPPTGRSRTIPVVYGGEHGPDLDEVAAACGMSHAEYVRRHTAAELRVLFCGFAPGFAYMGELPEPLRVPRMATPRVRTPAGSVAVAGAMTGIYPAEMPGGWRIIGRSPLVLFDPDREPPSYLAPGDAVRFESMDPADWPETLRAPEDW